MLNIRDTQQEAGNFSVQLVWFTVGSMKKITYLIGRS